MVWIRRIGVALGILVVLIAAGAATVYAVSERKLTAKYDGTPSHPLPPGDSAMLARGEHMATAISKCEECHGTDLGGTTMIDDAMAARVDAPNLTTGKGGVLAKYDDAALERAIRHGIGADGRGLVVMPSEEFNHMSDADLAALIAYLRTRPPVDREHRPVALGPIFRALWATGKVQLTSVATIDHARPHPAVTPTGTSAETGKYLANVGGCTGCHGPTLSGGPIPMAPPEWKPAANITPEGIGRYSLADFTKILREGQRPDGSKVAEMMPVRFTKLMSDDEIAAVYNYLRTVPPKPYGGR